MKLEIEKVFASTMFSLALLFLAYCMMRLGQQSEFSNYMHEAIKASQGHVDVDASYDNLKKSKPWDRDYKKMVIIN